MKLAKYEHGGQTHVGVIEGEGIISLAPIGVVSMLELVKGGAPALEMVRSYIATSPAALALSKVRLVAPIERPGKYLALGMNYEKHAVEAEKLGVVRQPYQLWFNKQTSCITGPHDDIHRGNTESLDYEVELGVVIGMPAKNITEAEALDHVFGYFVANDVSARDWQFRTPTFILGKGFDTYGPIGPWIVTADEIPDPQTLGVRCFVNGQKRQDSHTSDMIFPVREAIAYLSQAFTLEPGDLLSTGTPEGVGASHEPPLFLQPGDVVRCEIDRIGAIHNRVVA